MKRNADKIQTAIKDYLKKHLLLSSQTSWTLKKSELGGFGLFSTRSIPVGEEIFRDHPVIFGPRAGLTCPPVCVNCYIKNDLEQCDLNCGLLLCKSCKYSDGHKKECKIIRAWKTEEISEDLSEKLIKVLCPIRSLLLSDDDKEVVKCLKAHKSEKHGFEVDVMKKVFKFDMKEEDEDFMRLVCAAMDSNAFEVIVCNGTDQTSVRGLFPLASLANHNCTPNTAHVFDENHNMIVRALNFIPEGGEIFHSYSRSIWGTQTRRFHLCKTKHFLCSCKRCKDPTEFGTYASAILCKICRKGFVLSVNPMDNFTKWQCNSCGVIVDKEDVARLGSLLGSALASFGDGDLDIMFRLLRKKLPELVPETNETVLELKYKIIWILGYRKGYYWADLTDELLQTKSKYCKDILEVLNKLQLGRCKMRGMILYELYCCQKEWNNRNILMKDQDLNGLISEAADILLYDVAAPKEIKNWWYFNKICTENEINNFVEINLK